MGSFYNDETDLISSSHIVRWLCVKTIHRSNDGKLNELKYLKKIYYYMRIYYRILSKYDTNYVWEIIQIYDLHHWKFCQKPPEQTI